MKRTILYTLLTAFLFGFGFESNAGVFGQSNDFADDVKSRFFSAEFKGSQVQLRWVSEKLGDASQIIIERSFDNVFFDQIDVIEGIAYGPYTDRLVSKDLNNKFAYYRITIERKNGKSLSSEVLKVRLVQELKPTIAVMGKRANLNFYSSSGGALAVKVFDNSGRIVQSKNIYISSGDNSELLHLQDLNKGMYFIRLELDRRVATSKFFIR